MAKTISLDVWTTSTPILPADFVNIEPANPSDASFFPPLSFALDDKEAFNYFRRSLSKSQRKRFDSNWKNATKWKRGKGHRLTNVFRIRITVQKWKNWYQRFDVG